MSNFVEQKFYVVLKKPKRLWLRIEIDRFTRKTPDFRAGEVAVAVVLRIPENILVTAEVPVIVDEKNIVRPEVKAS